MSSIYDVVEKNGIKEEYVEDAVKIIDDYLEGKNVVSDNSELRSSVVKKLLGKLVPIHNRYAFDGSGDKVRPEGMPQLLGAISGDEAYVILIKREKTMREKLSTIQKRENLNEVFVVDEKGNGGAHHEYYVKDAAGLEAGENEIVYGAIYFQNGARKLEGAKHGVLDTDLLEIVRHRLQCFQKGDFATEANGHALKHIEEALMWMNRRVEDRIERNVLGTDNK